MSQLCRPVDVISTFGPPLLMEILTWNKKTQCERRSLRLKEIDQVKAVGDLE